MAGDLARALQRGGLADDADRLATVAEVPERETYGGGIMPDMSGMMIRAAGVL